MSQENIRIRGARQHNLKNLDLDIRTGELTVVTGPSGSGKSSLVFDTLYAEGQRRYVETFSAYARQFLDRMDKPAVDKVEGVPPAIAIDQTNPVRSSRSTVGTMTELNDHLKLLVARAGHLFDQQTALPVQHDTPESIYEQLLQRTQADDPRIVVTFPVELPANTSAEQLEQWLSASGFTKVQAEREVDAVRHAAAVDSSKKKPKAGKQAASEAPQRVKLLDVVADRFRLSKAEKARVIEAIEVALKRGSGHMTVYAIAEADADGNTAEPALWKFSSGLHCPESGLRYREPTPSMFSFNSAVGACDACRGFGRVIGVDWGLVIPNDKLTLRTGVIKPIQTPAWKEIQDDLMRHAEAQGIPRDTAWAKLTEAQKDWVINGEEGYKDGNWSRQWYGIRRYFEYLETKSYKMHIRVLLSKYRSYTPCPVCGGARLKTESLLWRVGSKAAADAALPPAQRFMPRGVAWSREQLEALPGLSLHDLMLLPIVRLRQFFASMDIRRSNDGDAQALRLLHEEISNRLQYLCDVGIGYLTLDRQSRTLSGGEVQRINLTTALGTSLVNTLFVLDEPSIGLHPRDMERITVAMKRLRDAGNTLVVVEHDPAVMFAADRMIDMGPGPGEKGGQIVFDGTTAELRHADTLTGAYLGGRKQVGMGAKRMVTESTPRLILEGATEHNLQNVSVDFPLQRMVVVTGVSGSGKSTLIQDVLAPALMRHFGKPTELAGAHQRLLGADHLSDVVFVDQSPIGKTARSNPVSYVGAWDAIRELFATAPLSLQRGYTAGKFSFNSGDGRCPTCGGSGFEHVEMQFLSDVYLRCPDCDGKRYRAEILEVRIERDGRLMNVADVLELTVSEAATLFAKDREVIRALQPIVDVGLEYVKLGQPVPTLSGGEAQRLKLAGFLAEAAKSASKSKQTLARKGSLFLFDEPTTGLHFEDIAKLMRALRKLLEAGHSLIVIEHNLDVIRASDWLIDLGPDAGEDGGKVVEEGTPEEVRKSGRSYTAQALRDYEVAMLGGRTDGQPHEVREPRAGYALERSAPATAAVAPSDSIQIINAKEHNLKNLSVDIPRGKFNVVTGVSGSGKSTLAFDILFNEGQRRYLESLNAYARSIVQPAGRPEVDAVYGIPPTVAIEQRLSRGGRKSTVGTTTEVWHFLRLLYVKLGVQHCTKDGAAVQPQTPESITAQLMTQYRGQLIGLMAPLVVARKGVYTELADWARPRGYTHLRVDGQFLPTTGFPRLDRFKEHTVELPVASIEIRPENEALLRDKLATALELGKGVLHVLSAIDTLEAAMLAGSDTAAIGRLQVFSTKRACPVCATSYAELDPRLFSYNSKHGWCPDCVGTGVKLTKDQRKVYDDSVMSQDNRGREQSFEEPEAEDVGETTCPTCQGTRLNATARAVLFHGQSISSIARLSVTDVRLWIEGLALSGRESDIARDLVPEIHSRLAFLEEVGLGYLTLDRGAPTLSGGEAQRIRLASQIGSGLTGVMYVLDEPSIGLHQRDNDRLIATLQHLRDIGNSVIVVEHDEDMMRAADQIIDMGPGAGVHGGQIMAQGRYADICAHPQSLTGQYLSGQKSIAVPARRTPWLPVLASTVGAPVGKAVADKSGSQFPTVRTSLEKKPSGKASSTSSAKGRSAQEAAPAPVDPHAVQSLRLVGASGHNLRDVTVDFPVGLFTCVTGVSGSGKSTLVNDTLYAAAAHKINRAQGDVAPYREIEGLDYFDKVINVDQSPIGRTPRSNPATYTGLFTPIRELMAETNTAKERGYGPGRFSFNVAGGRCEACQGDGMVKVEMHFLPDVYVPCDICHGQRYNRETLQVQWKGRNIAQILEMTVEDAHDFFRDVPTIARKLQTLLDVGLSYIRLGQSATTLSGGEAQRVKLAQELSKRDTGRTLYILDEPTTGLHFADIDLLLKVLHQLRDAGNTIVVIEHNLDVIKTADWVIDMGPEGGAGGGQLVAQGTPEQVAANPASHTGRYLAPYLKR